MARKDGITEREFIIGERVLQDFKYFFKEYNENITLFTKKLPNRTGSYIAPCSILSLDSENRNVLRIVESDNKILSKIILCLASLCNEMNLIVQEIENSLIRNLCGYEDTNVYEHTIKRFSNIISKLLHVRFTLKRCQQVIRLLLKQMCAILGKRPTNVVLFPEAVERLSDLLVSIFLLDSILSNKVLSDHLQSLKHILKTYDMGRNQIALPTLPSHSIQSLKDRLLEIESEVLNGTIFARTIEASFDDSIVAKKKSCNLPEQFLLVILQSLTDLEKDEHSTSSFQKSLLHTNVLAVFNHILSGSTDKKISRRIMNLNRKTSLSCCILNGNVVWNPQTFLSHHLKLDKGSQVTQSSNQAKTNILMKESRLFSYQTCAWLMELDLVTLKTCSRVSRAGEVRSHDLRRAHNTLLHGMTVCERARDAVARQMAQTKICAVAGVRRADAAALCHLLETLQAAKLFTLESRTHASAAHARLLAFTRQYTTHTALSAVAQLKRNIREEKKYKNEQLDILTTLTTLENALKGPNSLDRILIAKLALSASALSKEEKVEMRQLLSKLEVLSNYNAKLGEYFDVSIMQCYKFIFDIYTMKTVEAKLDLSRLQLCASSMLQCAHHLSPSLAETLSSYIETRLRLQTHAHLQRSAGGESQPLISCAQLQSIAVGATTQARWLLNNSVERRLSAIFYNLTTVVLHDWRTYGEMRRLASRQFALQTVDDNLPMQTLDQGLDILEIMRNIDVFVIKYLYNMNDHVFVQAQSNNKHLNTVNITHVANSIRTHGIGIMATAVNFTYQFLQKKFYIFSQFMFDEHIKSKLLKEIRFFAENKTDTNELYPYENADKFNTDIRKLGIDANGFSYLDLFRILITQIGNALGYIRLVKAGGERCLADATCFIPNLQTMDAVNDLISNNSSNASSFLQKNINNIAGNFQEAIDYFKLLINVFAPVLLNKNNQHLRNFYMIIPPLTINFVEHSLTCKDRLNKRNRDGASFTDDGFAMGVTYITVLLKQTNILNSLHWHRSVMTKFVGDRVSLRKQIATANKEDAKLQQTLTLSEKRVASIEKEFELLMFNLNNAQIFFQKGNG